MQADDALVPLAHQTEKEVDHRQHVGQTGGDAGAHCPQAQELGQDEQRVQHQVGDAAHGHAEGGLPRLPLCPDEVGQQGVQDGGRAADHHRPLGIAQGDGEGVRRSAAQGKDGGGKHPEQGTEHQAGRRPPPEGDGGNLPGLVRGLVAQSPGQGAGAAHPKEVGDGGEHQEGGVDHRNGGSLAGLVEQAHKVGVRQVVDEGDHLAGHSGKNLAENGLPDGQTVKGLHGVLQGGHGKHLL